MSGTPITPCQSVGYARRTIGFRVNPHGETGSFFPRSYLTTKHSLELGHVVEVHVAAADRDRMPGTDWNWLCYSGDRGVASGPESESSPAQIVKKPLPDG